MIKEQKILHVIHIKEGMIVSNNENLGEITFVNPSGEEIYIQWFMGEEEMYDPQYIIDNFLHVIEE